MKAIRHWAKAIVMDAVCFGLLAAGASGEAAWAMNVFLFWAWLLAVASVLAGLFGNRTWFPSYQPAGIRAYHTVTTLALISVLAGLGMTALAAFQFLAMAGMLAARSREPKEELATGEGR